MIENLKKEIAKKIKREIKNRGDCVFLSNAIFEILDIEMGILSEYCCNITKKGAKCKNRCLFHSDKCHIHIIN